MQKNAEREPTPSSSASHSLFPSLLYLHHHTRPHHVIVEGRPAVFVHKDRLDEQAHFGPSKNIDYVAWKQSLFIATRVLLHYKLSYSGARRKLLRSTTEVTQALR